MKQTEATYDEINRHIHEVVMGITCEHNSIVGSADGTWTCEECGLTDPPEGDADVFIVPDYCSPDSPRRLLDDAEAKAIEMSEAKLYDAHLDRWRKDGFPLINIFPMYFLTATALQRATAIYYATKEGEEQ